MELARTRVNGAFFPRGKKAGLKSLSAGNLQQKRYARRRHLRPTGAKNSPAGRLFRVFSSTRKGYNDLINIVEALL